MDSVTCFTTRCAADRINPIRYTVHLVIVWGGTFRSDLEKNGMIVFYSRQLFMNSIILALTSFRKTDTKARLFSLLPPT